MKAILLFSLLFSSATFAAIDKFHVQNLDLNYQLPKGPGTFDKVGAGSSKKFLNQNFQIERVSEAFEVTSDIFDFTWKNPLHFIYDLKNVEIKKTSASIGSKIHSLESESLVVVPSGRGEYKTEVLNGTCEGRATGELKNRVMDDCLTKMDLKIKKLDLPNDFILYRILETFPALPTAEIDIPGDNLELTTKNGDYVLQIYIKYWMYAGLRSWGHVQYENNHNTIAIRVDQVKFGYLNVTSLALKKLKEFNTNPNIEVDPPWIKINIGKL
jgi:hypothetical protein